MVAIKSILIDKIGNLTFSLKKVIIQKSYLICDQSCLYCVRMK